MSVNETSLSANDQADTTPDTHNKAASDIQLGIARISVVARAYNGSITC